MPHSPPGRCCESGGPIMNNAAYTSNHERSLGSVAAEIRDELLDFIHTRVQMFKSELQETLATFKHVMPMAVIALTLLATAYLLLTLAVVSVVAVAFWSNPYHWFFAFLLVGMLWMIAGDLTAFLARNRIKRQGTFSRRPIDVLNDDMIWLQHDTTSRPRVQ